MDAERLRHYQDSNLRGISMGACQCNQCRHVSDNGMTCAAFPQGIPIPILSGKVQHTKPYPGDHGIRFEPRES